MCDSLRNITACWNKSRSVCLHVCAGLGGGADCRLLVTQPEEWNRNSRAGGEKQLKWASSMWLVFVFVSFYSMIPTHECMLAIWHQHQSAHTHKASVMWSQSRLCIFRHICTVYDYSVPNKLLMAVRTPNRGRATLILLPLLLFSTATRGVLPPAV